MSRTNRRTRKPVKVPCCPYCGKQAVLRDGTAVYARSYGRLWVCQDYPKCDSYVGCHKGTKQPLGRMANKELRMLKMRVHKAFDSLWKSGVMSRSDAYRWLSDQLMIPPQSCHIGMFDEQTCRDAIRFCANTPDKRIQRYVDAAIGATEVGQ
jgi:ssDNA-binding Zn-finger/Zn-ribbon topoisomerase 1